MKTLRTTIFLLLTTILLSGCSLLRFTINTGEKALSETQLYTRGTVRGYYGEFSSQVIKLADSISDNSSNEQIRLRALRWKINATSACASAVYQTNPEVTLVNAWVLALQMNRMMYATPDADLFGIYSQSARNLSDSLLKVAVSLATQITPEPRYSQLEHFVTDYCSRNPVEDMNFIKNNLTLELITYLGGQESSLATTTGLMSEVLTDMTERMSGYSSQTINEINWSARMLQLKFEQDSIAGRISHQADTLNTSIRMMAELLRSSPELLDTMSMNLSKELAAMSYRMNGSINLLFTNVDSQRVALEEFVAQQQESLIKQVEDASTNVIKATTDALPAIIRKIIFTAVAALIVLFSLPFAAGYLVGQWRGKKRKTKQKID